MYGTTVLVTSSLLGMVPTFIAGTVRSLFIYFDVQKTVGSYLCNGSVVRCEELNRHCVAFQGYRTVFSIRHNTSGFNFSSYILHVLPRPSFCLNKRVIHRFLK